MFTSGACKEEGDNVGRTSTQFLVQDHLSRLARKSPQTVSLVGYTSSLDSTTISIYLVHYSFCFTIEHILSSDLCFKVGT